MATLTIRKLDDRLKAQLRVRAAHHGRSMEMEAREILREVLAANPVPSMNLAEAIRRHVAALGGEDLTLPAREPMRELPDLSR
jgi:plasmid stability protein